MHGPHRQGRGGVGLSLHRGSSQCPVPVLGEGLRGRPAGRESRWFYLDTLTVYVLLLLLLLLLLTQLTRRLSTSWLSI